MNDERGLLFRRGLPRRDLGAGQVELDPLEQDGETSRLFHEVDGAADQRGFFVNLIRQRGQENDRHLGAALAQPAQQLDPAHRRHLPVEQYQIGLAVAVQMIERRRPVGESDDLEIGFDEVLFDRFPEQIVVVDNDDDGVPARSARTIGHRRRHENVPGRPVPRRPRRCRISCRRRARERRCLQDPGRRTVRARSPSRCSAIPWTVTAP